MSCTYTGCARCCQCVRADRTDLWSVLVAENGRAKVFDRVFRVGGILVAVVAALLGHEVPAKTPKSAGSTRRSWGEQLQRLFILILPAYLSYHYHKPLQP